MSLLAIVLALGACSAATGAGAEPGQELAATEWTGTTYAASSRATELGSVGYTARGDFSFRIDADGNVTGHAVVIYQPNADFNIINQKIGIARALGSASAGALGLPGIIPNMYIQTVVGVTVAWPDPLPTQHGPIRGRFAHGKLSLEWATEQKNELPAKVSLVYLDRSDALSTAPLALGTPWPDTAKPTEEGGQRMFLSSSDRKSEDGDVVVTEAWTWTARGTG